MSNSMKEAKMGQTDAAGNRGMGQLFEPSPEMPEATGFIACRSPRLRAAVPGKGADKRIAGIRYGYQDRPGICRPCPE